MNPRFLLIACAAAGLSGAASGQYKVTAPDGSVTYTDRPPVTQNGKVVSLGRRGAAASEAAADSTALPFELRQTVSRYPVSLYTGANCIPCDSGRQMLQQRGVPYRERQILSSEDSTALERLTGARTIPALMVGSQPLRGYNPTDWASYLDAAGYPAESRLPRGWQPPAPTPLVVRPAPAASAPAAQAAAAPPTPSPASPPQPEAPAPGGSTIRF